MPVQKRGAGIQASSHFCLPSFPRQGPVGCLATVLSHQQYWGVASLFDPWPGFSVNLQNYQSRKAEKGKWRNSFCDPSKYEN